MKSPFSIAVWTVFASVLVKILVFVSENQFTKIGKYSIFINIFLVMLAVFLGIREHKKIYGKHSSYLEDFKAGMKTASWFAILLSIFVYFYYNFIDITYFSTLIEQRVSLAESQNIDVAKVRETGEAILNPFFQTTVTLLGFIILGAFYSGLIAFFVRKMKGFGH